MSTGPVGSVTKWILDLNHGDKDVFYFLWKRYWERLVKLADTDVHRLHLRSPGVEEDVAQQVFTQVWQNITASEHPPQNRKELWRMTTMFTYRESLDYQRHEKAKKRKAGSNQQADLQEAPDIQVALEDDLDRLESLTSPMEKQIIVLTLEGFDQKEIGEKLDTSERTIQRKLATIRKVWLKHFNEPS